MRGPGAVLAVPTGLTLGLLALAGVISAQLEVITSLGPTWLFAGVALSATARVRSPATVPTETAGQQPVAPSPTR